MRENGISVSKNNTCDQKASEHMQNSTQAFWKQDVMYVHVPTIPYNCIIKHSLACTVETNLLSVCIFALCSIYLMPHPSQTNWGEGELGEHCHLRGTFPHQNPTWIELCYIWKLLI